MTDLKKYVLPQFLDGDFVWLTNLNDKKASNS